MSLKEFSISSSLTPELIIMVDGGGTFRYFGKGLVLVFGFVFDFSGSMIFPKSMRFWISCFRRMQESVGWPAIWWNLQ